MSIIKIFSVNSNIEFLFKNQSVCDFSYDSYIVEFAKLQTKRSKVTMKKKETTLIFHIESKDITAFRASISDIIGLGKIIENTYDITQNE